MIALTKHSDSTSIVTGNLPLSSNAIAGMLACVLTTSSFILQYGQQWGLRLTQVGVFIFLSLNWWKTQSRPTRQTGTPITKDTWRKIYSYYIKCSFVSLAPFIQVNLGKLLDSPKVQRHNTLSSYIIVDPIMNLISRTHYYVREESTTLLYTWSTE